MKILKEQEKDKSQLKTLIEKNNQLEYSVSLAEFFHKDFIQKTQDQRRSNGIPVGNYGKERQQNRKETKEQNRQRTRYKGSRTDR